MAVSLSSRCLQQAAQLAFAKDAPKGAATPRLLGSKTPTKTPKTPGQDRSPSFLLDFDADKGSMSPVRRPAHTADSSTGRGGLLLRPPTTSPSSSQPNSSGSPSPSKRRHALRFADDETCLTTEPKPAEEPEQAPEAPRSSSAGTYNKESPFPVMLGKLGSLAHEPAAPAPADASDASLGPFADAGDAPALARAAFLARRGTLLGRTSSQSEDKPQQPTHTAFASLEYPVLLGKEGLASPSGGKPAMIQITADDPAALARANFFARRERISSRRLGELGA